MSEPTANTSPTGSRLSRPLLLVGLGVVGLVVIGVVLWTLFRGDAPAAVDLEAATAELADDGTSDADTAEEGNGTGAYDSAADTTIDEAVGGAEAESEADSAGEADPGDVTISDVSGTWTVDTSVGEFSFEDSTGTYVGFRVGEELTTVGVTEAVGRTPNVSGTVTIDGQTVTATEIEADMAAITTDISQRDGAARRALDTSNFPTATFVLTEPIDLGADPASGDPVSATAAGDLTIRDVTNTAEFALDAQLVGDTIAIVGTTDVVFADYGVDPPSAPVVVSLDDFGIIEFQLFLTRE